LTNSEKDLTLEELRKASNSLDIAQSLLKDALEHNQHHIELHKALRDSCIQRFEFCVELSWKISMKVLGLNTKSPNLAIREMAQNNLIENPEMWFEFLLARNKTSHTYNEDIAKQVYEETVRLQPELVQLISRLEKVIL
jgi:nucleotidyltransferase substrate binding protein (TIGR01987 family)